MSPIPSSFFQPITYDYPKTNILSLPCKKSHGLYSSPTKLLKCSTGIIALVLSELFIISISLGRYPTKLKLSKNVPVFKSDHEKDPNNYRPMSLLSNFNRIFKRLIYTRMMKYIEKHNWTFSSQCGFRKGHSTQHAI